MDNAIDGKHTVFYRGVTALPISWKKEYLFGTRRVHHHLGQWQASQKGSEPLMSCPLKVSTSRAGVFETLISFPMPS